VKSLASGRVEVNVSVVVDAKREMAELRRGVTDLDRQLVALLDARARAARRLAELRQDQPPALPLMDQATIGELMARSTGDMPCESLRQILGSVFAACLALELPVAIAIAGPEGGLAHVTARGRFGRGGAVVALETTAAAIEEVSRRAAEYAVVPYESSAEGPILATIRALTASDLRIVEMLDAPFDLALMSLSGEDAAIQRVVATATDHALCQRAVEALGAGVTAVDVRTPLLACEQAAQDPASAALAIEPVGAELGLRPVRRGLVDRGGLRFRFAVLGARPGARAGRDVTALVFGVQPAPGALLEVLKVFADRGLDLTRIQSQPMQGETWSYLFFAETVGHFTDRPLVVAFEEVKRLTRFFKLLGSYPAG